MLVGLLTLTSGPTSVVGVFDSPGRDAAQDVAATPSAGESIVGADERDQASVRIELVTGDEIATATLGDTPEARAFAAMLPITVDMGDPFGQAKTGQLPRALPLDDPERSRSYAAGDLSYCHPAASSRLSTTPWAVPCLPRVWSVSGPCRPGWRPSPPRATTSR